MRTVPCVDSLLSKHRGVELPALVCPSEPDMGLLDPELLKSFYEGFQASERLTMAFLLPNLQPDHQGDRWANADYAFPDLAHQSRSDFCSSIRARSAIDERCMECDRKAATLAAERRTAIAYICPNGLCDIAAPVLIEGTAIAVILGGQLRPRKKSRWSSDLLEGPRLIDRSTPECRKLDIAAHCKALAEHAAREASLPDEEWRKLYRHCRSVTQKGLTAAMSSLETVSRQVAALAEAKLSFERAILLAWLRAKVAKPLEKISAMQPVMDDAWQSLGEALAAAVDRFGLDYLVLVDVFPSSDEGIQVLAHAGLDLPTRATTAGRTLAHDGVRRLRAWARGEEETRRFRTREFRGIEPFETIHNQQKKAVGPLAIRLTVRATDGALVLLAGRFGSSVSVKRFLQYSEDTRVLISDVKAVCDVIRLMEQQAAQARRQALFVEDVAHDIRSPVQTMLAVQAELSLAQTLGNRSRKLVGRIGAIVRRLNLMSERVWVLERVERQDPTLLHTQYVSVLQLIQECRRNLLEIAEGRSIRLFLSDDLRGLPQVQVNRDLFFCAMLNLMDNAIKYSREGTEVRVYGDSLRDRVEIRVVNRGIPVPDKDRDSIFSRYFRSENARAFTSDGMGIGLAVARAFADTCGGIRVESKPVEGSQDFITTFFLHVTRVGW